MQSGLLDGWLQGSEAMKRFTVATVAVLAFLLVAPSTLALAAPPAGNDSAPVYFSQADWMKIYLYFGNSANIEALPAGMKKYLQDNRTLPGGWRALTRGTPLSPTLLKLVRPAPKDLVKDLSVGGGSLRVVMIGHNVVLLDAKGNIVRDFVMLRLRI